MTSTAAIQPKASLSRFEACVLAKNADEAFNEAIRILQEIDTHFGGFEGVELGTPYVQGLSEGQRATHLATRYAAAFAQFMLDPAFSFSPAQFEILFLFHRWIDLLFSISGFQSTEYLMPLLADNGEGKNWSFTGEKLIRFLILYSLSSSFEIDFEQCLSANAAATLVSFINYLGTRYCFTPKALAFRERLLNWLPGHLDAIKLGDITLRKLLDPYMQCSYAYTDSKHIIKRDIVKQIRRACLEGGSREMPASHKPKPKDKPTIVVVTEQFHEGHSVFRTHSRSVRALKERFHVVGMIYQESIDDAVKSCFNEIVRLPPSGGHMSEIGAIADEIMVRDPAIVFYLGIGMRLQVIALASLRLAPIQCVSFGHTATTMSPTIDYMILPEDFVKSRDCYSEQLLLVPPAAMPYAIRLGASAISVEARNRKADEDSKPDIIRIAVPASVMKLNARFFETLGKIRKRASIPTEFHFFPLGAAGVVQVELGRRIHEHVPGAIIHREMPHNAYLAQLGRCDFFLSPFPYGNMNSIVDAVQLGLPGVCLDGKEAHAHADAALFTRLGLPEQLIAATLEEYISAATRLINDADWRSYCVRSARQSDVENIMSSGDESLFAHAMADLIKT